MKVSNGRSVNYIYRQLSMTEQTYYSWRRKYRGIKVVQTKRLRDLEKENTRLKKSVGHRPGAEVPAALMMIVGLLYVLWSKIMPTNSLIFS